VEKIMDNKLTKMQKQQMMQKLEEEKRLKELEESKKKLEPPALKPHRAGQPRVWKLLEEFNL
jgi:hypothetical protein